MASADGKHHVYLLIAVFFLKQNPSIKLYTFYHDYYMLCTEAYETEKLFISDNLSF